MDELEKFAAHFERNRAAGLTDMRFFLNPSARAGSRKIIEVSNRIDDAIAAGRVWPVVHWDADRRPARSSLLD